MSLPTEARTQGAHPSRRQVLASSAGFVAAVIAAPLAGAAPAPRQIIELLHRSRHGWPVDLTGAVLAGFDLTGIDFKSAILARADLFGANLTDANLAGAQLMNARLDRAVVTRAELSGANLEDASLLSLTVFTELERNHREAPRFAGARMARASVSGFLDYSDFRWAGMTDAQFGGGTSLIGAKFAEGNCVRTRFGGAALTFAHFAGADLREADLSGCELSQADFSNANVAGMNVAGADLHDAIFNGARGIDAIAGLDRALNSERVRS